MVTSKSGGLILEKSSQNRSKQVKLTLIDPPGDIVRMDIDEGEIIELARSIEEQGLLQPIVVNENRERYEIVAGHRRFLAVQSLKGKTIEAKVVKMDKGAVALARATENLQRRDLTPLEEGVIYWNLKKGFEMDLDEISRRMGKSPAVIKRRMDILRMPAVMQKAIHAKTVSLTVCEELMSCGDAAHREYLLVMAIEHGVTKDVARMWVQDWKKSLRIPTDAGIEGRGPGIATEAEIIYRPCDACKGPVDLNAIRELRMCPECYGRIVEALKGGGDERNRKEKG